MTLVPKGNVVGFASTDVSITSNEVSFTHYLPSIFFQRRFSLTTLKNNSYIAVLTQKSNPIWDLQPNPYHGKSFLIELENPNLA